MAVTVGVTDIVGVTVGERGVEERLPHIGELLAGSGVEHRQHRGARGTGAWIALAADERGSAGGRDEEDGAAVEVGDAGTVDEAGDRDAAVLRDGG